MHPDAMAAGKVSGAFVQHCPVAADQRQVRAEPAKRVGNRGPYTPRRAGDERVLARKRRSLKTAMGDVIGGKVGGVGHDLHD